MKEYTGRHARAGLSQKLPPIECFPNQFPGYVIVIENPEFTSVCPRTGLPDFGIIRIEYTPAKLCLELKSIKLYFHAYRSLGIFQENAVNRILADIVRACRPVWAQVTGEFNFRGGMKTTINATYPRRKKRLEM